MWITPEVARAFPGIHVSEGDVRSVLITEESPGLETLKLAIIKEIKTRYTLEQVKDEPVFRAYRDFFWSVGIDPTKTRPASEALVRRVLSGGKLPTINTAVDAYNLASLRSGIPIAAFDADTLAGDLTMRFARDGELFLGIGMENAVVPGRTQVIITDAEQVVAIYPYRDSDATKVAIDTRNIRIVTCGVPKIEQVQVVAAYDLCTEYLGAFTGGVPSRPMTFTG